MDSALSTSHCAPFELLVSFTPTREVLKIILYLPVAIANVQGSGQDDSRMDRNRLLPRNLDGCVMVADSVADLPFRLSFPEVLLSNDRVLAEWFACGNDELTVDARSFSDAQDRHLCKATTIRPLKLARAIACEALPSASEECRPAAELAAQLSSSESGNKMALDQEVRAAETNRPPSAVPLCQHEVTNR